jgi:hypothetical protein
MIRALQNQGGRFSRQRVTVGRGAWRNTALHKTAGLKIQGVVLPMAALRSPAGHDW